MDTGHIPSYTRSWYPVHTVDSYEGLPDQVPARNSAAKPLVRTVSDLLTYLPHSN